MKIKVIETFEVTAEEIGEAFGLMGIGEQCDILEALEEGLLKAAMGDIDAVRIRYECILQELHEQHDVKGITITPSKFT